MGPLKRILWIAIAAYGAVMTIIAVLMRLGGSWSPVEIARIASPWLLMPALPLLAFAALQRRPWIVALLAVPTLAFASAFGPLFLPQRGPPSGRPVRVMTYNLHDGGAPPERLVELVREVDADLVGLEELNAAEAGALEGLADEYPYRAALGVGQNGKGLLSKFPMEDAELFTLAVPDRPHLRALVTVDGVAVRVIVAHPHAPAAVPGFWGGGGFAYNPTLREEVPALAALATAGGPTLLVGDMNFSDGARFYRVLAGSGLHDAFREAGWGLGRTWPVNLGVPGPPFARLDYVWYTDEFSAAGAHVGPDAGSDHLPVVADLVWEVPGPR